MVATAHDENKLVYDQKRREKGLAALAEVFIDRKTGEFFLLYLDGSSALLVRSSSNQLEPSELIEGCTVPTRKSFERQQNVSFEDIMFGEELLPSGLKEIIMENERNNALA